MGPAVSTTLASESTGRISPARVTTGRLPTPCVRSTLRWGPLSMRSMRLVPTVTSTTRRPSLKASTESANSRAVTPLSASRTRSG